MVRQLCVRALSRGVGSIEYVDSLLIMEDDDDIVFRSLFSSLCFFSPVDVS